MVKLNKSSLPLHLEELLEKKSNPALYRDGEVFERLVDESHHKCYICEDDKVRLIAEHIRPHKGDKGLEYDWRNILPACDHCNSVKGQKYDNILNCLENDPEEYIAISMPIDDLKMSVKVSVILPAMEAEETKNLLDLVHNITNTAQRREYTIKLRRKAMKELMRLKENLVNYGAEQDIQRKEERYQSIVKMMDRSSPFAAIKRNMIRSKPIYMKEFGEYLS